MFLVRISKILFCLAIVSKTLNILTHNFIRTKIDFFFQFLLNKMKSLFTEMIGKLTVFKLEKKMTS